MQRRLITGLLLLSLGGAAALGAPRDPATPHLTRAAATLPTIVLPATARQGATVVAQVDPKGATSCSFVARRGKYSAARRIAGGAPYALELRIAPRAARTAWRVTVRCDRTLGQWQRLKVTGRRKSSSRARGLVSLITVQRHATPTPGTTLGPDEQGFTPAANDTQEGLPSDEGQLGAGPYDNARIADLALSELGRDRTTGGPIDHGQCKQSVNDWVNGASGGTQRLGGNYHSNYASQGGQIVSRDAAVKGDVIQLHNPANERAYFSGMHTAVVVGHAAGSETFDVVDANWGLDGVVSRHAWNPYASGRKYGLAVTIWRMGSVAAPATSPPPAPAPTTPAATPPDRLCCDGVLRAAGTQHLRSPDQRYLFIMQGDGNLVLYGPSGRALWNSRTDGSGADRAVMQGDGNLVVYAGSRAVWNSRTDGRPNAFLAVQNDGNVVIYSNGKAVWATGTDGRT